MVAVVVVGSRDRSACGAMSSGVAQVLCALLVPRRCCVWLQLTPLLRVAAADTPDNDVVTSAEGDPTE